MTKFPLPRIKGALFAAVAGVLVLAGCGKKDETPPPAATAPVAASTQPATAAPAAAPATAWQPAALDELLAPIALYPDVLLGKILAASQDPQQVLDAGNWLLQNLALKGPALDNAAEAAGFGPQMRALLPFPDVVDMMCQNLDWTTQLGEAFGADQRAVLDSVQRLRNQAVNAGNFKTTPQQKVETQSVPAEGGGTKEVVVVEPAKPEVVYVPKYDPAAVYQPAPTTVVNNYGTAPATTTSTTTSSSSSNDALVGGLIGFGAGILIANAFDDDDWDDYYRPSYGYGYPPMPPPPMYRPPYGYGGGAYNRPPNYGNAYNRPVHNGNTNVNINVDNNYFNRFPNNPNRPAAGATQRPGARPSTGAVGVGGGATAGNRGPAQGSYAGARPGGGGIPTTAPRVPGQLNGTVPRASTTPATPSAANRPQGSYAGAQGRPAQASNQMQARPASGARPTTGAGAGTPRPTADRGYGGAQYKTAQAKPAQMTKPAQASRPAPTAKPAPMPQSRPMPTAKPAASSGGAFKSGGGGADRAASSRGRQSMSGGGGGGAAAGGGRRGR